MSTELVGRDDELATLGGLVTALPASSAAVIVRGEAGIGKTALVRVVLDGAGSAGLRVLRGACAPMSGAVAYGGLDPALMAARSVADGLVEPSASSAEGRARAVGATLAYLRELARDGAVLAVEDLHWADTSTLDFLAHLCRNLPESGLLVVCSWRDEDTDPARASWLGEQLRNPAIVDVSLRRLTLEETVRQLADYPAELGETVYRQSAGNPYLSSELARGGARPSASLRQVLGSRLDAVAPATRQVVGIATTLGRALTDDELLVAASGDAAAVHEAYESGLMVRELPQGWMARHPVLAEVAYEQLLAGDRRALHRRMAEHLAGLLSAHPSAGAVAEVAEQYERSGDPDQAMLWAVRAAQLAEQGFAIAEAGHWYAVAAAQWDDAVHTRAGVPAKLALLNAAAGHLGAVGQPDRAMALLSDLSADTAAADLVVSAALTRSWLAMVLGGTDDAVRDVELAESLASPDDELTWARIYARRAMVIATAQRWDEAIGPARAALELGTRCNDTRTIGTAQILLGLAAVLAGDIVEGLGRYEIALVIAHRLAEPEDLAMAGVMLTDFHWRQGDTEQAARVARVIRRAVRPLMLGRHWLEDVMDSNVVAALYEAGRWDEALDWLSEPSGPSELGFFQGVLALVRLARGDVTAAAELQDQAESLVERDQPQFVALYGEVQTRLLLQTGRAEEALQLALSIAERVSTTLDPLENIDLLAAGLEAAATVAAPEALERLVSLLKAAITGRAAGAMVAMVEAERSRAIGEPRAESWLTAAQEWAALGRPYDEARARVHAAEALLERRTGPEVRRTAAEQLRAAKRFAEQLGAVPLLADIDRLGQLARVDVRVDTGRQTAELDGAVWPPVLTEREQQVLALLTEGLTNREIGEALFMSPKTASVHVTHLMEKFGVQSRVQVAAVAARLGLDKP
ncbi:ATP-binding protein [Kribbella sp. NPDC050470]|uniref:ATP-binding protein n=1 Tax=unclassified Kribbella TaxID=2644121 RepID=UPI0037A272C2